ncbi:(NiFe) hydrogenase maturation protein HypF [Thermovibrio ammonificans HB-1]|uniref:Carbamoyltransferase n=1 Tax=Thermovibrio ammonificans (strain DSM 15698 / JCM 12110 / HB-1) TaxID=648996 RepID=E8T2I7_THEA1|nr:carbamoyltransferase HypF [Thermovibrio ammonificans]ADU97082.1 (NiFe) hydrogenase maturation protein HypF [Thermovibrio ammonificans HB-1]
MRLKLFITGAVQGVGFRPFIYRLATQMGLKGFVLNSETGVVIEVEGEEGKLRSFIERIKQEKPPAARIYSMEFKFLPEVGYREFQIKKSQKSGEVQVAVLPDLATCPDCLRELFNPQDRRYRYPFINCTNCGPRFTIILSLPYDRENTTMREFKMCPECLKEYRDPKNRRFHAQPNACPACGPKVWLVDETGQTVAEEDEAVKEVCRWITQGKIVAVKGLGGFHLICDATNEKAVRELRRRKNREEKPFAVMFKDLNQLKEHAYLSPLEEIAVTGVESPIVILRKKKGSTLAPSVSPDTETVGAFLPYTPLHHLICREVNRPLVATSCNITDEPIMKENSEAIEALGSLLDGALCHNRPIARRCDDSVVRVIGDRVVPIRRSRGYAPLPVLLPFKLKREVLAIGPHMKVTVAVGKGNRVFISQHVGDTDNLKAEEFLKETVADMLKLFECEPEVVVCDHHPGYFSTKLAKELFKDRVKQIYHHHAHAVSVMAENEVPLNEEIVAVTFDGTGLGPDGTVWGGEVLKAGYTEFERLFHLKQFKLPGGDKAVKEPFRCAVSLLLELGVEPGAWLKGLEREVSLVKQMVEKGINSPTTSSMGRLFDGVAALLGIKLKVSYQAQGAILLEEAASGFHTQEHYPVVLREGVIDWSEMVEALLKDIEKGVSVNEAAAKFHNWVVESTVEAVKEALSAVNCRKVGLSGGVFQNRILTEKLSRRLREEGITVLTHQIVPPNDGGICLGQAVYGGLA